MRVLAIFEESNYNDENQFFVEVDESEIQKFKFLYLSKFDSDESYMLTKKVEEDFYFKGKYFFIISQDGKNIRSTTTDFRYSNQWNGYSPFVDIYVREIEYLDELKNISSKNMHTFNLVGAIAGDIIGSVYEWDNIKTTDFDLFAKQSNFTDDTVMTIAVADCILNNKPIVETLQDYGRRYPNYGYGGHFNAWLESENPIPYNSWGNGSAMRTSAVGYAFNTEFDVIVNAKKYAEVTHNHPEGIKGAQAISMCIYLARTGASKKEIKEYIEKKFNYDLSSRLDHIRPIYQYDVSCQGTVPPSIIAFLESYDYENAIRLAISIGGDSDTIACITGSIAQAFYKDLPIKIVRRTFDILTDDLKKIVIDFGEKFSFHNGKK